MPGTVLVTGGAGYIGAHACKSLARAGYVPVTYDNLSTGWAEAVKFGPFKPQAMRDWVKSYRGPDSGTPLGVTIETASRALMNSKFTAKHILVVTDGMNTSGPDPVVVVPKINKASESKGSPIFIHFVAFDIDAKVFAPLKKLGVTVVGAVDEKQLGQQLEFILEEKILLEKEPVKK